MIFLTIEVHWGWTYFFFWR